MKLEILSHSYQVPLTRTQWNRLNKMDFLDGVYPKMKAAGIIGDSIEYNGHFGRNIYFDAPVKMTEEEIIKVLQEVCS